MTEEQKTAFKYALKRCELDALTYSPGDGATRYKFVRRGTHDDYFSAPPNAHALGLKEAMTWLDGYEEALIHLKEQYRETGMAYIPILQFDKAGETK